MRTKLVIGRQVPPERRLEQRRYFALNEGTMAVSYLIEILLPVTGDLGRETLETVKSDLTQRFGGVTLHANIPAEGLWMDDKEVERDRIVVVEVMTEEVDRAW